jgi:hypothetical protein
MPRGLGSAQCVVIAVGVDAQDWALAVDDPDGVAFAEPMSVAVTPK